MPSSLRELLEPLAVGAVADHAQRRVDAAVAQARERAQHVVAPRLTPVMRPIQPTTKRSSADAHHPARALGAASLGGGDALVELDPEPDDGELLGRRDAERDEVVAHLRADRDERVGRRGRASARASRKTPCGSGPK